MCGGFFLYVILTYQLILLFVIWMGAIVKTARMVTRTCIKGMFNDSLDNEMYMSIADVIQIT